MNPWAKYEEKPVDPEDHAKLPPVDASRRRYYKARKHVLRGVTGPRPMEDEEAFDAYMANRWGMGDQSSLPSLNAYMTRRRGNQQ